MKSLTIIPVVLATGIVCAVAAPARADECNKLVYLTFSAPVGLPGVTLPAGTYRFSHPDCAMTNGILRVSSEDGTQVYGTFLTFPEERATVSREPEVMFAEMPAGSPRVLKAWFYPDDTIGDGLVYPTTEAARVASAPVQKVEAVNGAE